jgi:hypothetical protein
VSAVVRPTPRKVGVVLFLAILSGFAVFLGLTLASPGHAASGSAPDPQGTVLGTTEGWLNGQTVTFLYTRDYFCAEPPASAADSGCEVGADAETKPVQNPDIPELWVLVPIGFDVPASTLQCPIPGNCVAHPHDIDLSRVFGAGASDVPTPAHSHIIDDLQGGWWESYVVGILNRDAWDRLTGPEGRSLSVLRELQDAGDATPDIPSNLYLFFQVLPEETGPPTG